MAAMLACRFCRLPIILKDPPGVLLSSINKPGPWELSFACANCGAEYAGSIITKHGPTITKEQLEERRNKVSK